MESQMEKSLRAQDDKFKRLYSKVRRGISLGIFSDRVEIIRSNIAPRQTFLSYNWLTPVASHEPISILTSKESRPI